MKTEDFRDSADPTSTTGVFPGYTDITPIYEGAETFVFRARSEQTGEDVILKQTKNEYPTARERGRLRREFVILRELEGLQVPRAIALEELGRQLVLMLEQIPMPTLREVLAAGRLEFGEALSIAISLSKTLAQIHAKGVIHKDLTPQNILVDTKTWEAHIIDFGISARVAREVHTPLGLGNLEGTLRYLAPEQTGRMNRGVDLRADLYSLGVILYEMLTGIVPFRDQEPADIVLGHLTRRPIPPRFCNEAVPTVLSDIVLTLLEKTPEDRYQSDAGLRVDLEECLGQWRETRSMLPFARRGRDRSPTLRVSDRLHGREAEVKILLDCFERACAIGPELVLVSGFSGIGKSALVHEVYRFIAKNGGGYFVSGKFDKISRDVPLAPIANALRELVHLILAEPQVALESWKARLLEALSGNGRVLTDLVPDIALIIGEQPPLPELLPDPSRNRFEMALQDFLHVFASAKRPLVVFLDDMQWMDPASQHTLQVLLTDPYNQHQLFIGAYRDNEVDSLHPLSSLLSDLAKKEVRPTALAIGPLDQRAVGQLVADMLTSSVEETKALADIVYTKTLGNPFFAQQLLFTLEERGVLHFDATAGRFQWDERVIRASGVTDNVGSLMVENLKRLAPETQRVLMLAACLGHSFDLHTLIRISGLRPAQVASALFESMRAGLLVSFDNDYKFVESGIASAGGEAMTLNVEYRFVHDRVLEAAYGSADEEERKALHLSIGRMLRGPLDAEHSAEDALAIVHHLNRASSLITDQDERIHLVQLDLSAAIRAKRSTAYHAAADLLAVGISMLKPSDWTSHEELCFSVYFEAAQNEGLRRNDSRAEALIETLFLHARDDLRRVKVMRLRIFNLLEQTRYREALEVGSQALALLGQPLSMEEMFAFPTMMSELGAVMSGLAGRAILDIAKEKEAKDLNILAALSILDSLGAAAFHCGFVAFSVVNFRAATIALKHGVSELCPYPFSAVGYSLAGIFGKPEEGMAFGELANALNKRFPSAVQAARFLLPYASSMHNAHPIRYAKPYYASLRRAAVESGELNMLGCACFLESFGDLFAGDPLEEALQTADSYLAICRRTRDPLTTATMTVARQAIACLAGKTKSPTSFDDDGFQEAQFIAGLDDVHFGNTTAHYYVAKTFVFLLFGQYEEALAMADLAEARVMLIGGNLPSKMHSLLRALALVGAPKADSPEESARREEALAKHIGEMAALAVASPKTYGHGKMLLDAEIARRAGDVQNAIRLYEEALSLAKENNCAPSEAMAAELCAKFYLSIGAQTAAFAYMRKAYRAFEHWGANAKVAALVNDTSQLFPNLREVSQSGAASVSHRSAETPSHLSQTSRTLLGRTNLGSLRDAALVVRAAQEIAGELDLQKVIARLTRLVLDNAGADRGALILSRNGSLCVETQLGTKGASEKSGESLPLEAYQDCAHSVVLYVARTQEAVVIDDTSKRTRFLEDTYLVRGEARSLMCVPLLHQGRLSGVLYLENHALAGVFHAARVELITLLSSQAAIAIEIAHLIESSREANEAVRRVNERLELEVAHRTEELRHANENLSETNEQLERELEQRRLIEQERAALQEQVISTQRERLAEMSTPLLPITKEIVVMPLIGAMDTERAEQVLSVALSGVQRTSARVVILDVTGMKQVDTHVASMLLNVASALRLLGAETVLTGIAPKIAQTLVALDVDFKSFVTKGNLQSAMEYALRRSQNGLKGTK